MQCLSSACACGDDAAAEFSIPCLRLNPRPSQKKKGQCCLAQDGIHANVASGAQKASEPRMAVLACQTHEYFCIVLQVAVWIQSIIHRRVFGKLRRRSWTLASRQSCMIRKHATREACVRLGEQITLTHPPTVSTRTASIASFALPVLLLRIPEYRRNASTIFEITDQS